MVDTSSYIGEAVKYFDNLGLEHIGIIGYIETEPNRFHLYDNSDDISWVYIINQTYPESNTKIKILNEGTPNAVPFYYEEIRISQQVILINE